MVVRNRCFGALFLSGAAFACPVMAQTVSPSTVTPETLRPEQDDKGFRVDIPEAGGLTAPAGAENLSVTLAGAAVDGGFAEVAGQTEAALGKLRGQKVSLAQIYAAASEIEAAHARAGFVLARVSVPPQELRDGGAVRIVVTDGFIEAVDTSGVPERVRGAVAARAKPLEGQRHLRLADIEQPLLIANDVPGLTLKSTLMRGAQAGGAKLVLEGQHKRVSGSIGGDNQLAPSLGRWSVNAQISLNSVFGGGEQIYGFVSSGYDVSKIFGNEVRARVLGAGAVIPLGNGRLTLNPEVTFSKTQPTPVLGAPPTTGTLRRLALRAGYTITKTRAHSLTLSGGIEQLDESNKVPLFGVVISHDRYMAARLGLSYDSFAANGASMSFAGQISQGLGKSGGISVADTVRTGIGYSRQGAGNGFTKFTGQARGVWPLGGKADFSLSAKGQTGFGKAMLRSEQFSLEGGDGVSAYVGGITAVDDGLVARAELSARLASGQGDALFNLSPYAFVAGGTGSIKRPTVLEPNGIKAAAFGAGLRANQPHWRLYFSIEYAHGISNFAPLDKADRVNASVTFRF